MKTVIVASENPVKIEVAKRSFAAVFPNEQFDFVAVKSASGVPDQPMDEETIKGAENRMAYIKKHHPKADYWISQEGGLLREGEYLIEQAWVLVTDSRGYVAKSSTGQFYLPKKITEYIKNEGMELGHAGDKFFDKVNSKHGIGVIGQITDGIIGRAEYYLPAAIIALSELKHREWY